MAPNTFAAQAIQRPWLLACACLGAGWAVGQWLRWEPPATQPLWEAADEGATMRDIVAMPTLHPIVEKVAPGVVGIQVVLTPEAANQVEAAGVVPMSSPGVVSGSGFVVHPDGLVVTSRHLVEGAQLLIVQVNGAPPSPAELVGEDRLTDLAVLRLQDPPEGLQHLTLGKSEDLRQGDWVVTVGNPRGYSQTVTPGLVSYVGRHLPRHDMRVTGDFIQFSAPVNPGSSGGPVINMRGHVVGVVAHGATDAEGISFAVPSRTLKWVLDEVQRRDDGLVRRGFLGIRFSSERMEGVMISRVEPGQPAALAGLRPGDVILEYRGQVVGDAAQLHEWVTTTGPGATVDLLVRRGSETLPFQIELGEAVPELPADEGQDR